jgi:hypothetical protein
VLCIPDQHGREQLSRANMPKVVKRTVMAPGLGCAVMPSGAFTCRRGHFGGGHLAELIWPEVILRVAPLAAFAGRHGAHCAAFHRRLIAVFVVAS